MKFRIELEMEFPDSGELGCVDTPENAGDLVQDIIRDSGIDGQLRILSVEEWPPKIPPCEWCGGSH